MQRRKADPFTLGEGPVACLLLHGFAGSPAEVRLLGQYLADRGIAVHAPLLPGHGTTPEALRETRWPDWVRAADGAFSDLERRHQKVHVVGFSMGGLVALHLAARREVASVVTLSSPARLRDWRQLFVPLAKLIMPYYPTRVSNPDVAAEIESYDRLPLSAVHSLMRLTKQVRKDLPRITAPYLAMQGERDKWIDEDSAQYLTAHVSSQQTKQVYLPGRNHMITLERGRDEVFAAVHRWIEMCEAK